MKIKFVEYSGKKYISIPIDEDICYCICDNMRLTVWKYLDGYHVSGRVLFTEKILNRIYKYGSLDYKDEKFYKDIFSTGQALQQSLKSNNDWVEKAERLIELLKLIYNLEYYKVNRELSELTNGLFTIKDDAIYKKSEIDNVFGICKFIFENLEEKEMGMFDNFFKESVGNEKFYPYVSGMSGRELLNAVNEEYYKLKGTSDLSPYMGEYGSFEFAGALLLWKYAGEKIKASGNNAEDLSNYGSLLIMLADTIGCAFNHMSPGEWSDKIDDVINSHDEVITYSEWSEVYNYLKENYSKQLHQCEFNTHKLNPYDYEDVYSNFVTKYNYLPDFNSVIEYYSRQGLGFKKDIWFRIDN